MPAFFNKIGRADNDFQKTLEEFLDNLAIGVVNIIHAFNPEMVVIGGGVMASGDLILPGLKRRVHKMAWTHPRGKVCIRSAELGNKAAAMGVAFHPAFTD